MTRKIYAGILALMMMAAVGCSDSGQKNEMAESKIEVSDASESKTITENKNTLPSAETETKNPDVNAEASGYDVHMQENDKSKSDTVTDNNKSNGVSNEKSNEVSGQQNETPVVMIDEEDIIYDTPTVTSSGNKSLLSVTTTSTPTEDEEIIVTESVIELPFVPAR